MGFNPTSLGLSSFAFLENHFLNILEKPKSHEDGYKNTNQIYKKHRCQGIAGIGNPNGSKIQSDDIKRSFRTALKNTS